MSTIRAAMRPRSSRSGISNVSKANSSPPSRAITSAGRTTDCSRLATTRSTASPTGWPSVSLTALNRSRSIIISAGPIASGRAGSSGAASVSSQADGSAPSAASTRFSNNGRLGRPVSASRIARSTACASSARREVTSSKDALHCPSSRKATCTAKNRGTTALLRSTRLDDASHPSTADRSSASRRFNSASPNRPPVRSSSITEANSVRTPGLRSKALTSRVLVNRTCSEEFERQHADRHAVQQRPEMVVAGVVPGGGGAVGHRFRGEKIGHNHPAQDQTTVQTDLAGYNRAGAAASSETVMS